MPTYEYACEACGHRFELFQSITAQPARLCPRCKRSTLRRLIGTGAALLFKGSGFYKTDYRSPAYSQAAKTDGSAGGGKGTDTGSGGPNGSGGANGSSGSKEPGGAARAAG